MNEIVNYLKSNRSEILKDIEMLVKKESPTDNKQLVDECGIHLSNIFTDKFGIYPEIYRHENTGNHLLFKIGDYDEQILILGHFDTVWDENEIEYKEDGNIIYGPGIIDMKGGLILSIWAVKALMDNNVPLNKNIVFLCNGDHEGIASPTSRPLIESEAKKSDAVIVPEASQGEKGNLKTFRKGVLRYTIEFHGQSSHSGNNHEAGHSAILELAKKVSMLEGMTNYEKGITCNVGIVKGGSGVNMVPDYAELKLDIRVAENEDATNIDKLIREITPEDKNITIKIDGGIKRPVLQRTEPNTMLWEIVKDSAKELQIEIDQASVGGGSDGSFASALDIPTIDGIGCVGGGPHAKNEHIKKDFVVERSALIATLIKNLTS